MSTSPNHKNCLQLEEIELYVKGKLSADQVHVIEHHLLNCELCNDAVEGFSEQPFSAAEIPAFESLAKPSFSTFPISRWINIAAVVLICSSIALYYNYSEKEAAEAPIAENEQSSKADSTASLVFTSEEMKPDKNALLNELIETDREVKELVTTKISDKNDLSAFGKKDGSAWMMPQKKQEIVAGLTDADGDVSIRRISKDTFLFDLKITAFDELYAIADQPKPEKSSATEARYEGKDNAKADQKEPDLEQLTTQDVLMKAMDNFSRNNFTNALKLFNILISYEPNDVNALFYASLCYKNLNRAEDALGYLDRVLSNSNSTFNEEAEWEKAQAYVQLKDFKKAEVILEKIVASKGFYAERSKDLLKRVKQKNKTK